MRRLLATLLIFVSTLSPAAAHAENVDSVSVWGNYYKERSTRVVSPVITLHKALPHDSSIEATYLVDQITSASAGATVTDHAFQEYRNEVGVAGHLGLFDDFTVGLSARYSYEEDYTSVAIGADLAWSLFQASTTLGVHIQRQHDGIKNRAQPGFKDTLDTTMMGISVTRIMRRDLLVGLTLETQILSGYTENPYRIEQHPRRRNRYAAEPFLAYRYEPTRTTVRLDYRLYGDTWSLVAHTFGVDLTQRMAAWLEFVPSFRYYTQGDVFFVDIADCSRFFPDATAPAARCITSDPKLKRFSSRLYGARAVIRLQALEDTLLSVFARSTVEPAYALLDQDNAYGTAHIVQLGWHWPF
ncbi:MAG: DUF3570 domain-containing protein [Deltaproteobacteria bacterium]|nr:DUF3570 domain-containing protein [Deltaproteobacteria bacterium]